MQALVGTGRLTGAKGAYHLAAPVDEITIPATVTAVLAARIDRLAEREKAVLQMAAVIGKEFSEPVLQRVLGAPPAQPVARALLLNEQWSDAAAALEQALAEMRERQAVLSAESIVLADLAQAVATLGDLGRARGLADDAVSVAQERHLMGTHSFLTRACVLRASDGAQAATAIEADLRQAMAKVERTEARAYVPLIHAERAELARLLGDEATYQRELREAHRLFVEMGATGHAERLVKELGL